MSYQKKRKKLVMTANDIQGKTERAVFAKALCEKTRDEFA